MGFLRREIDADQDFEINIASIIDCFTVLITYLLACASFISIGVFDVSVLSPGPTTPQEEPKVNLSIRMDPNHSFVVKVSGAESATLSIPPANGVWDLARLSDSIRPIKERWADLNTAVIAAEENVPYRDLVKVIETAKDVVPAVYLGDRQVE